jgi:rubrerythrin
MLFYQEVYGNERTKTEKNLLAAFAGESQARNRYTYFASTAKKEGYEQIAALFLETADNEKEHAKRFFNFLEGGMSEFTASFPAGRIGTTAENLRSAQKAGEWTVVPGLRRSRRMKGFARRRGFARLQRSSKHGVSGNF